MKTFREKYNEIETELSNTYSELIKNKVGEFIFLSDEDVENGDYEEYFEVRNDITGNTYDVHIIQVDEHGVKVVESEDDTKIYYIKFSDLADVQDRINLIENMQQYGL